MKKSIRNFNKDYYGYIFIAPFVIIFITFILYPIYNTFFLSVTNAHMIQGMPGDVIGFENFIGLFNDPIFWTALGNTWFLWISNFIPQIVLALVLAAMFTSTTFKLRGMNLFKAIYYLPNLLMPVTIAALFTSFMHVHGPLNQFLVGTLGVMAEGRNFLGFPFDTRVTVIFLNTWMWFGHTAIVLVAGMTTISPTFYESAMIDGASQSKMFFHITLPLIKPILLFVLVTSLVGGLQMFDIPLMLAGPLGNPQNSVLTVNMLMNLRRTPPNNMIGSAASISIMLFFVSSFVALILFRVFREPTDEQVSKRIAKKTGRG
jgi:multiple sugar transport system permease protein